MNSLHDAVQSRNGPAEAAANGEINADATSGWCCHTATAAGRRPPATRTVTDSGPRWRRRRLSLYQSEVTFIYLLQKII